MEENWLKMMIRVILLEELRLKYAGAHRRYILGRCSMA